jgi:zinc protease
MSALVRRLPRPAGLLLAAVLAAGAAGPGRPPDPPVSPWRTPPVMFDLDGGVRCLYQKDDASPTTVIGLFIGGGRASVPPGLDGLAAISTRLLLEIPDEGKVRDLMAQATRLSYVCLDDHSVVLIECLSENVEEALRVAAKIIQDPLISGLRVNRAKDLMTANGKIEADDAVTAARAAVFSALFGATGYGSALYGTKETLKAIGRKDVLAYVRRSVVKPNLFFCVESDLDRETIARLLESSFDAIPDGPAPEWPRPAPALPADRDVVLIQETKQTYLGRAYPLPRAGLADMAKGLLLETVLGKGPGSRLWSLRAEQRLAYSVDADLSWTQSSGVIIAHLETDRTKAPDAAAALDRVLEVLRKRGIPDAEMGAAKAMARARFLRAVEEKTPRLRTLGLFEVLGTGPDPAARLLAAVEAVSGAGLSAYAREVLAPERALRVTVGPLSGGLPCPD